MTVQDKKNYNSLIKSLDNSHFKVSYSNNNRDTESLYRFGWFTIEDYEYSISAWSFKKRIITFEDKVGNKVKYSIRDKSVIGLPFKKDTLYVSIKKRIKNKLVNWLKDLSDKLQS